MDLPGHVLDNFYIGSVNHAYDKDILDKLKITHILTVADKCPPRFPEVFNYKVIRAHDTPNYNIF